MAKVSRPKTVSPSLPKCPTGVAGLDEITCGGLPRGRPTLLCGAAGCGKTVLAMEFLIRGATQFNEPGLFMCFEETAEELAQNVRSLGFDVPALCAQKKLAMSYVRVERSEIEETGEYDLEGLFIRLNHAIDSVGAKRVVLDTIESLFSGLSNAAILRAELRRLFRWLKDKGVTAVITAERGDATLTRQGLEEYVSDCVILLDHRIGEQVSTRRLRIVKYRGTTHGTNEYPFYIGARGFEVLPVTSVGLNHGVSDERVSTGVAALDEMLSGGLYRGSSVLVSGTAGTGKSTLAASFVEAACRRGERCLYLAFEESPAQIIRNMRSSGVDLAPWVRKKMLHLHAARPTICGLEAHLVSMFGLVRDFQPRHVVFDPVSCFMNVSQLLDVRQFLTRVLDQLKTREITTFFTSLTTPSGANEESEVGISSLIDTWLLLRDIEESGERNKGLYVLKSRGMAHSNQIREFILTGNGPQLREVYLGPTGMLTGSARVSQEGVDAQEVLRRRQQVEHRERQLARERTLMDAQLAAIRAEFQRKADELQRAIAEAKDAAAQLTADRRKMATSRKA